MQSMDQLEANEDRNHFDQLIEENFSLVKAQKTSNV